MTNTTILFSASVVTYSIISGNTYDAFSITNYTGEIRVKNPLDYENITSYTLDVRATDGIFDDYAKIIISVLNINDNPPVFVANYSKTIQEETEYNGCVVKVRVQFSIFIRHYMIFILNLLLFF